MLVKQVGICPQTQTNILPLTYKHFAGNIWQETTGGGTEFHPGTNSEGLNELFATGDIVNVVLQRFFADVNIYDNSINLWNVTSPVPYLYQCHFYQYYIMDTLDVEGDAFN